MTKETRKRKRKRQRVIEDDEATSKRTVDEQPESIANDNEHAATQVGTPTIDPPRESYREPKRKKKKKKKKQKRDGEPSDTKVSNRDEDGDTPAQVQTSKFLNEDIFSTHVSKPVELPFDYISPWSNDVPD